MEPLSTKFFSGERTFTCFPQFFPKLTTWSRNTIRSREKDHFEAWNLYIQVLYRGNLYQRFNISVKDAFPHHPNFPPKWITRSRNTLRRRERFIFEPRNCSFRRGTLGISINDFSFLVGRTFYRISKFSPKWITRSRITLRR